MNVAFTVVQNELFIRYDQHICKVCVLPESFPGISFDDAGVCSHCRDRDERIVVSRQCIDDAIEHALADASQRDYDCVVLFSGGKDSSLALTIARRELGLRVLAFTLDNGFLSAGTSVNMRRILDSLDVDHVLFRPPGRLMRPLYNVSMKLDFDANTMKYSTGGCGSCISMVLASGLRFAVAHSIPLLVGGWTPGQFTTSPLVGVPFLKDVIARHFTPLSLASTSLGEQLAGWRVERHKPGPAGLLNPLYAMSYSEDATLDKLAEFGWKPPEDTDSCSTNCRLNGLLIVDHVQRYGFHPYAYELAHHVRLGALSREDALAKISRTGIQPGTVTSVAAELGLDVRPVPRPKETSRHDH
ncbi:hypothetical protein [Nonomuraea sp. NPDC050643]|uniref:hypothetical protein n=1 Tax=Nonomuraea sp. NPDC050643 TaxID=3155660 RepID=UPI0033EBF5B1